MNIRPQSLSSALILMAATMVVLGTLYFASLRPGYSHIANTISELGETGAPRARLVAYGFFFPVGLMVWLALWLIQRGRPDKEASAILLALSCLGTGYVVSAFAPCDPGGPLFGSWRTLVHNLAGLIDYGGTGVGFLLVARRHTKNAAPTQAAGFVVAGASCLVCLVLLLPVFHIRGGVQRVVEVIQFTGVFFACLLLSKQLPPNASQKSPSLGEFVGFWNKSRRGTTMMKFYGIWLGGLAVFEFVISRVGFVEHFPLLSLIGTFAYLILFPYFALRNYREKFDRFLRCPKCRDWFGSDLNASRFYPPPNPKWEVVLATSRCPKCGAQILSKNL